MNRRRLFTFWAALALVSEATCLADGKVVYLKGTAKNVATGEVLAELSRVHAGDVVATGDDSRLRLKLDDEVAVELGANSELKIEQPAKGGWLLKMEFGRLMTVVREAAKKITAHRVQVQVRDTVMGVRGTIFFVGAERAKPTYLCVCRGKVDVRGHELLKSIDTKTHKDQVIDDVSGKNSMLAPAGAAAIAHSLADANELVKLVAGKGVVSRGRSQARPVK